MQVTQIQKIKSDTKMTKAQRSDILSKATAMERLVIMRPKVA